MMHTNAISATSAKHKLNGNNITINPATVIDVAAV